jgi:hypothetical protein
MNMPDVHDPRLTCHHTHHALQEDHYGVAQLSDPGLPTILQTLLAAALALKAALALPVWRGGGGNSSPSNGGAVCCGGISEAALLPLFVLSSITELGPKQ